MSFKNIIILSLIIICAVVVFKSPENSKNIQITKTNITPKMTDRSIASTKKQLQQTVSLPENEVNTSNIVSTPFHIISNKKRIYDEEKMQEISKSANFEELARE